MPANLTPQYKEAEERFRRATGHDGKLAALREMMAILPRHKGTEKIQGDLGRRLSKLEEEGELGRKGGVRRFDPGHVEREGAGQWVMLGPANAGKSALLKSLTHAHPEGGLALSIALLERLRVWPARRPLLPESPPSMGRASKS